MRSLRGVNVSAVIKRLNPIIRGWAAYYRTQVSSDTFSALDNYLWKLTYKWARLSHPNKSRRWVISRYFDRFDKSRQDRWVFGNRQRGSYLHKFAWTTIIRHQMVSGGASPDDPSLTEYWVRRRRKATLPINNTTLRPSPGWSLSDLQRNAQRRRGPASTPAAMGTLAGNHPHRDHPDRTAGRHVGRG